MQNTIHRQFDTEREENIFHEYGAMLDFVQKHRGITYDRFDGCLVRNLNLFAIREELDFSSLEEALERIIKEIPTLKRILSKPIIRLKDTDEVLPVEAVRLIDNRTLVHASVHSELWESTEEGALKPRRLMTVQNEDFYAIYENLVVIKAVDCILEFVSNHICFLNDLLYTDRNMQFNLLERINHLSYFLAIGKLHIGYVRDYDKNRSDAERCLEKLLYIDRVLRARLGCKLYRCCHSKVQTSLVLHKTNIFRMHKDYHRIFLLMKWFEENGIPHNEVGKRELVSSLEGYRAFGSMLSLFAIGHFNFVFDADQAIDFEALDLQAHFRAWNLHILTEKHMGTEYLLITVDKEKSYRVLLVFDLDPANAKVRLTELEKQVVADEYLILTPQKTVASKEIVQISLYDVESFRRIQQILLRSMIYADIKRDICPFCGHSLSPDREAGKNGYRCGYCRMQIHSQTCTETQQSYAVTGIFNYSVSCRNGSSKVKGNRLLREKQIESALHFRNITSIDEHGAALCPICGKRH